MTTTPSGPTFPGSDVNADGFVDIFWRNTTGGQISLWTMENQTQIAERQLPTTVASPWNLVGAADFTGDGVTDLLWHNSRTGDLTTWELNTLGNRVRGIAIQTASLNWRPVGVGDFNGDGKTDILWNNTTNQELRVWFMNNTVRQSGALITTRPAEWQVGAVADFNRDGRDDLVWMNQSTGRVEIWAMNGTNQVGSPQAVATASGWRLSGTGDFNNDGNNDLLLWHAPTGRTSLWTMNGTRRVTGSILANRGTAWLPMAQARGGLPDLTVENLTGLPASLTVGESATIRFSVTNQGTRTAVPSTFRYYLSNDTTVSSNDQLLGSISVGALRAGQSATFTRTFAYNADVVNRLGDSGTKNLLLVADAAGAVTESREDNNLLSQSFEVVSNAPTDVDLVLQNPVLPETWVAGLPVSLTLTVANQGSEEAGASLLRVFLSDTPTFNPNGRIVVESRIASLPGQESFTDTFTFTYLESFGDGQKYLFVVVDSANEVSETGDGETNNITQFDINVAPAINVDFTITSVTPPVGSPFPNITVGQPITVTVLVKNQGTTVAAPTTLTVYTSDFGVNGNQFDIATARPVTSAPVGRLDTGEETSIRLTFTYTSDFGEGTQNLFFVLDVEDAIEEANENNNVWREEIEVEQPQDIDLAVLNPSLSRTTVLPGDTINLSAQVQNLGGTSSGTSTWLRAYISTDTVLDDNDIEIGGAFILPLGGNSATAVLNFGSYTHTGPAGTYYVLFVADADNNVFETNEDNVSFLQFTALDVQPGIDLLVASATSSLSTVTVDEQLTVRATVQNQGEDASGISRLGFYISDDAVFNPATDQFLGSREIGNLTSFETSGLQEFTFTYLDAYGLGNKFILVVADDNRLVTESNENNNVQAISLSVLPNLNRPDLIVSGTEFGMTSSVDGITVRYFVQNQGPRPTTSGSVTTAFYLSNTPITSLSGLSSAVFLGTSTVEGDVLENGGVISALLTLEPGQSPNPVWSPGQKFLVVVADSSNGVIERDETNNVSSFAITLT
ncbi:peptidase S8 [Leptolyngbya sp. BL0902]|uniref:CARDB domain-containing protein n=1 Tax=Leptolyngbya sp. BL0902 TaxID=1115757 RepID=UPI0018E883B2|nr:CARDB domain-containing protein [Leptolyngbya sp. BL0902]QQE66749.1 peptidase S8 [Leptolyngbya sp. BL0902]